MEYEMKMSQFDICVWISSVRANWRACVNADI